MSVSFHKKYKLVITNQFILCFAFIAHQMNSSGSHKEKLFFKNFYILCIVAERHFEGLLMLWKIWRAFVSITTKQISMKMFQRKFLSLNASWLCFSAICDSLKWCQISLCVLKQRKIHIHYVFLKQFCTRQFMELSVSLCALVLEIILIKLDVFPF